MKISSIIQALESLAHPSLQESYDNAGLLTGNASAECTGIICSLDMTEAVVHEAVSKGCNMVVAHHPIIFKGLKKITGSNYAEKAVIAAIKNDIALYAIHTNLDNVIHGVSGKMAELLQLQNIRILAPAAGQLKKLYTFVPLAQADAVRQALFTAGAGNIGQYNECSFNTTGEGTFTGGTGTNPFVGEPGKPHRENEIRVEMVFPAWLERGLIKALLAAHPYEEVAYDIISLDNNHPGTGSGLIGDFAEPLNEEAFLARLRDIFKTPVIRHSRKLNRPVKKLAICGGAGSFLISRALSAGADAYVTGDLKYHEFFDANDQLLLADIGHFESEQFTIDLLQAVLAQKFPTFAVLKTSVQTNPVHYS